LELRTKKKLMKSSKRNGLCSFRLGGKEENHEVVCGGDRKEVEDQIAPLLITTKTHMGPLTRKKEGA
jgi:hypothetical protein